MVFGNKRRAIKNTHSSEPDTFCTQDTERRQAKQKKHNTKKNMMSKTDHIKTEMNRVAQHGLVVLVSYRKHTIGV